MSLGILDGQTPAAEKPKKRRASHRSEPGDRPLAEELAELERTAQRRPMPATSHDAYTLPDGRTTRDARIVQHMQIRRERLLARERDIAGQVQGSGRTVERLAWTRDVVIALGLCTGTAAFSTPHCHRCSTEAEEVLGHVRERSGHDGRDDTPWWTCEHNPGSPIPLVIAEHTACGSRWLPALSPSFDEQWSCPNLYCNMPADRETFLPHALTRVEMNHLIPLPVTVEAIERMIALRSKGLMGEREPKPAPITEEDAAPGSLEIGAQRALVLAAIKGFVAHAEAHPEDAGPWLRVGRQNVEDCLWTDEDHTVSIQRMLTHAFAPELLPCLGHESSAMNLTAAQWAHIQNEAAKAGQDAETWALARIREGLALAKSIGPAEMLARLEPLTLAVDALASSGSIHLQVLDCHQPLWDLSEAIDEHDGHETGWDGVKLPFAFVFLLEHLRTGEEGGAE